MRITKQIDFRNVGELSRQLRAGKVSTQRFSLEIPVNDCANGLYASYNVITESLGKEFVPDEDTKNHILASAKWLTDPKGKPALMLCGLYGNGKTTLAKAIQRFVGWITEKELGYSDRKVVKFFTAKEIVRMLRTDAKRYEKLFTEEMLIIDELGEEAKEVIQYGMIDTPMIDLISERYDRRLFTIITTNLETNQLRKKYGGRIYDRFVEMLTVIVFENDSYRRCSQSDS